MSLVEIEERYQEYIDRNNRLWEYGNGVLYRMCEEQPEHKDIDVIAGKLWLIGRSYAAAIERRKDAVGDSEEFYYNVVAPKMLEIRLELDDKLNKLRISKGSISDNIDEILTFQKFLVDTFYELTGLKKRSLASKYLHFHCPEMFFIYDSRSKKAICKMIPKAKKDLPRYKFDYDPEYADFVCRMIELQKYLEKQTNTYISPRTLDSFLLSECIQKDRK